MKDTQDLTLKTKKYCGEIIENLNKWKKYHIQRSEVFI